MHRGKCAPRDCHNLPARQRWEAPPFVLGEEVLFDPIPVEPPTAPPADSDGYPEQGIVSRTLRDRYDAPRAEVELLAAKGAVGEN